MMPFDGQLKPEPIAPADPNVRWDYTPGRPRLPRTNYTPVSDLQALRILLSGIRNAWAKQLNAPDNAHCIVGWVVNACEPMSLIDWNNPQTKRLLQRLHHALPKSAQRKTAHPRWMLSRYNDTHTREAVYRVAERAYISLANELVDQANSNGAS